MLRLVLLIALLCACALADQKVARLFVLNSTPDLKFGQSSAPIVPENVAGVLGHVMGLSGLNPLPEVPISTPKTANQAKANLLVVVDGAPVQGFSELDQSKLASFDVESSSEESNTELLSRMFGGKVSGSDSDNANLGDLLCQLHDNSLVLTLSAQSDLLESVSLHDQLVRKNPNWNVLRGQYDAKRSKLNLHGKGESALKEAIKDLFTAEGIESFNVKNSEGKAIFDETTPADELFLIEMKALSQLLEALGEAKTLLNDASPDFVVFVSSSLRGLREKYGVESVQFVTALSKLNSLLSQIQEQVGEAFANQAVFEVLLVDAHQRTVLMRERRAIAKRDYTNIASQCFTSLQQCLNSTSNCSSEGNCTLVKNINQGGATVPCYRCKCSSQYAGESCEFINIVAPFHIIFWVSLTLILALILISYALAFMDPGTDTLLFKTASRPKKE